jgi:hypothetical protein
MVRILEKRNQEANLIRDMDNMLQVCSGSDEAYAIIKQFGSFFVVCTSEVY